MRKYPKARLTDADCNDEELRVKLKKVRREKRALRGQVKDLTTQNASLREQAAGLVRPTHPSQIDLTLMKSIRHPGKWCLNRRFHDLSGTSYHTIATNIEEKDAYDLVDGTRGINGIYFLMGDPREKKDEKAA